MSEIKNNGSGPVGVVERGDNQLGALLDRIHQLTTAPPTAHPQSPVTEPATAPARDAGRPRHATGGEWLPIEPTSLVDAGLTDTEVEALILKTLNGRAEATGRYLSDQIKLQFRLIDPLLQEMKQDRLVAHKGAAPMNDYVYQLTELGHERAKKYAEQCTYFGAAPVSLPTYIESVKHQTLADQHPTEEDLHRAFEDLLIDKKMLLRLGPAINSGRGLFLFGAPGNGKTSIAERITKAFGQFIWIPRAIGIDGEIMRMFDPGMHEESPLPANEGLLDHRKIDHRWVRIRRPTIVVGGELTMDQLEVTLNTATNVSEAPIADEEQLRHAGDRRLRPAADDDRPVAQPLDRAAGKAVRLPEPGQRQEDSGSVRSVDRIFDEPGAEAAWSTTRSCAVFPTRSKWSIPTSSRSVS